MRKSCLLFLLLSVFNTIGVFSNSLKGFYSFESREVETTEIYQFDPQEIPIFVFDKESKVVSFVTSSAKVSNYKLLKGKTVTWCSKNSSVQEVVSSAAVSFGDESRSYKNSAVLRIFTQNGFSVMMAVFIIGFIAVVRIFFSDAFYVLLVPFKSYSATIEKMAQTSRITVLLSVVFLIFLVFAFILLLNDNGTWGLALYFLILVFSSFFFKWLLLNRINKVFGDVAFGRVHLLEFLRFSVFIFTLVYFVSLIIVFNNLEIDFLYGFLWVPFVFIWFIRLFIIYNKRYDHNFLYFFCYLCATEVLPVLLLVLFWKEK